MDAADRIIELFDCLLSLDADRILTWPFAEQVVFVVVCARCEKDINGFASIFVQAFEPRELEVLTQGLRKPGEPQLADDFALILDLLERNGFYRHRDWDLLSPDVRVQIDAIGDRIGDQLWSLDEKMVALIDAQ